MRGKNVSRGSRGCAERPDRDSPGPTRPTAASIEQLMGEETLPFSQVAKELDCSVNAVTRWAFDGILGRSHNGERRRKWLEHFRLGGKLYTTRAALARFVLALDDPSPGQEPGAAPIGRTPAERRRADAMAAREAERLGC